MKKIIYILGLLVFSFTALHAQEGDDDANGKVKERFREYMQQRLNLSKEEADRTFPLFLRYFNEIRLARREFPNDQLKQKQKVIEIKIRYREEFRQSVKERPERVDPDRVEKAAIEFRQALKVEAEKRNLQIRRRGGSVLNKD